MNAFKTTYIASALALLVTGMAASPAQATSDEKSLSPMRCQPLGPNTTIGELTISHNGIYNPGSTPETVTCELPMDSEGPWATTPANSGHITVYYSTGSISGKLACTMYVGSTQMQTTPVYSTTQAPSVSPPYTRTSLFLNFSYPSTDPGFNLIPINLECIITPKATMAAMFFYEAVATNTP
jgi:hypothetical protein